MVLATEEFNLRRHVLWERPSEESLGQLLAILLLPRREGVGVVREPRLAAVGAFARSPSSEGPSTLVADRQVRTVSPQETGAIDHPSDELE